MIFNLDKSPLIADCGLVLCFILLIITMCSFFESVQKEIALSSNHIEKITGLVKNKNVNVAILKEKLDKDKMANIILEAMKK